MSIAGAGVWPPRGWSYCLCTNDYSIALVLQLQLLDLTVCSRLTTRYSSYAFSVPTSSRYNRLTHELVLHEKSVCMLCSWLDWLVRLCASADAINCSFNAISATRRAAANSIRVRRSLFRTCCTIACRRLDDPLSPPLHYMFVCVSVCIYCTICEQ